MSGCPSSPSSPSSPTTTSVFSYSTIFHRTGAREVIFALHERCLIPPSYRSIFATGRTRPSSVAIEFFFGLNARASVAHSLILAITVLMVSGQDAAKRFKISPWRQYQFHSAPSCSILPHAAPILPLPASTPGHGHR